MHRLRQVRKIATMFFFKQKTAYEIVDCDWSSDVCSSDLDHAQNMEEDDDDFADFESFESAQKQQTAKKSTLSDRKSVV